MSKQNQIYIELLEYAFDADAKIEVFKPKHAATCKEYYLRGISLGAPNGRFEWSCSQDCPINGIASFIGSPVEADFEEEED